MMFNHYACPVCEKSLRDNQPVAKKSPWYKFIVRHTFLCPHCGAEIEKRFSGFDAVFASSFFAILGSGGFVSVWRLVKVLIPLMLVALCVRFLAGIVFSRYVRAKRKT